MRVFNSGRVFRISPAPSLFRLPVLLACLSSAADRTGSRWAGSSAAQTAARCSAGFIRFHLHRFPARRNVLLMSFARILNSFLHGLIQYFSSCNLLSRHLMPSGGVGDVLAPTFPAHRVALGCHQRNEGVLVGGVFVHSSMVFMSHDFSFDLSALCDTPRRPCRGPAVLVSKTGRPISRQTMSLRRINFCSCSFAMCSFRWSQS